MADFLGRAKSMAVRRLRRRFGSVQTARAYTVTSRTDEGDLSGNVAVVTGASGALGRAIATMMAARGAHVYMVGRNVQKLASVADEIAAIGGTSTAVSLDVTDPERVEAFFESLPRVDILVNNAGGSAPTGSHDMLHEQTMAVIDAVLELNLRGTILCTRAATRHMVEQGVGTVVNIGSVIAARGKARYSEYAAAKAALEGLTRSLAVELGPHGITVNCCSPGGIPRGVISATQAEKMTNWNALGRLGSHEDVAEAVCFLASPRTRFITGQNLVVDGGRSLSLRGDH